jgi:hypothetical protein
MLTIVRYRNILLLFRYRNIYQKGELCIWLRMQNYSKN